MPKIPAFDQNQFASSNWFSGNIIFDWRNWAHQRNSFQHHVISHSPHNVQRLHRSLEICPIYRWPIDGSSRGWWCGNFPLQVSSREPQEIIHTKQKLMLQHLLRLLRAIPDHLGGPAGKSQLLNVAGFCSFPSRYRFWSVCCLCRCPHSCNDRRSLDGFYVCLEHLLECHLLGQSHNGKFSVEMELGFWKLRCFRVWESLWSFAAISFIPTRFPVKSPHWGEPRILWEIWEVQWVVTGFRVMVIENFWGFCRFYRELRWRSFRGSWCSPFPAPKSFRFSISACIWELFS